MECPTINHLKFDHYGQQALQDIRDIYDFSKVLTPVLAAGTMLNIFLGNNGWKAVYSFASTDFVTLTKALQSVPEISRDRIYRTAAMAAVLSPNREQQLFFQAVATGCKMQ